MDRLFKDITEKDYSLDLNDRENVFKSNKFNSTIKKSFQF